MIKVRAVVGVCILLAMPTALLAQRGARRTDAGSKDAIKVMARPAGRGGMAGYRAAIGRTNQSVLTAANRLSRRAPAGGTTSDWIRAQSLQIQSQLHIGVQQLDKADAIATPAEKRHLAQIRSHEEAALTSAGQLVAEAQKPRPDRAVISTRAHLIYQQIQAVGAVTATDDWTQ